MSNPRIILAVDTPDLDMARNWIETTSEYIAAYKLGLEFFLKFGPEGVRKIREISGADLFLDLKLHDIPNTVASAVAQVTDLAPRFLTVHASGGSAMISAAVENAPLVEITAVTVLTSLSDSEIGEIGFAGRALDTATNMAKLAVKAGAAAIVCSPLEVVAIREAVGPGISIITPGVRPADHGVSDDQARTMTPEAAVALGASYVVIGRPITGLWKQGASAMAKKASEISEQINKNL